MKHYLLALMLLFCGCLALAQESICGEIIDPEVEEYLRGRFQTEAAKLKFEDDIRYVPVQVFIIRRSDGTGGANADSVHKMLEFKMNPYFQSIGFHYYHCADAKPINSDVLFNRDWNADDSDPNSFWNYFNSIPDDYYREGVVNLYVLPKWELAGEATTGAHAGPGDKGYVALRQDYATLDPDSRDTFAKVAAHEFGHFFSLRHTHQGYDIPMARELVLRVGACVNCFNFGDQICDTPADPYLFDKVNYQTCAYTGTGLDECQNPYTPDVQNIMSYAPPWCQNYFSSEQLQRMRQFYDLHSHSVLDHPNCYCSPCYNQVELPNEGADTLVVNPKVVRSKNGILSVEVIQSEAPGVAYKAAGYVCLNPGFETKPGSVFRGLIDDCFLPAPNRGIDERSNLVTGQLFQGENLIEVSPNPTTSQVQWPPEYGKTVTVLNANGQILLTRTETNQIDLSTLPQGIYFLQIRDDKGGIKYGKVMKK